MKIHVCLMFLCLLSESYSGQSLSDSLLIYYPFYGNAQDQSGHEYDGVVNATLATDQFGNANSAFSFNGVSEYIDLPNVSELKPELPISYSARVMFNSLPPTGNVMFTNNFAQDNHSGVWMQAASTGELAIAYGSALGGSSDSNIRLKKGLSLLETGVWYLVVGVVRGPTDMDLYINCVNDEGVYGGNSTAALAYTSDNGSIGRKDNAGVAPYHFDGLLDEFRYWNRALDSLDVELLCTHLTSVHESFEAHPFIIYPNPTSEHFGIANAHQELDHVIVCDINGRELLLSKEFVDIDISHLPAGLYSVQILNKKNQMIAREKLIIE